MIDIDSLYSLLKKAEAGTPMSASSQAMAEAARIATPAGAPPMPKPIEDPGAEQQGMDPSQLAKSEQQHRNELDAKNRELNALNAEKQNLEIQLRQAQAEAKIKDQQRQAEESIRSRQMELERKQTQFEAAEERHRAQLEKATAQQEVARAKSDAKSLADIAKRDAESAKRTTEQNTKDYIAMLDSARSKADAYMASRQKELNRSTEAARKNSPYISVALRSNLDSALTAAQNVGKLRQRIAKDNVKFASLLKKANPAQTAAPMGVPAMQTQPLPSKAPTPAPVHNAQNPIVPNPAPTVRQPQQPAQVPTVQQPQPQQPAQAQQPVTPPKPVGVKLNDMDALRHRQRKAVNYFNRRYDKARTQYLKRFTNLNNLSTDLQGAWQEMTRLEGVLQNKNLTPDERARYTEVYNYVKKEYNKRAKNYQEEAKKVRSSPSGYDDAKKRRILSQHANYGLAENGVANLSNIGASGNYASARDKTLLAGKYGLSTDQLATAEAQHEKNKSWGDKAGKFLLDLILPFESVNNNMRDKRMADAVAARYGVSRGLTGLEGGDAFLRKMTSEALEQRGLHESYGRDYLNAAGNIAMAIPLWGAIGKGVKGVYKGIQLANRAKKFTNAAQKAKFVAKAKAAQKAQQAAWNATRMGRAYNTLNRGTMLASAPLLPALPLALPGVDANSGYGQFATKLMDYSPIMKMQSKGIATTPDQMQARAAIESEQNALAQQKNALLANMSPEAIAALNGTSRDYGAVFAGAPMYKSSGVAIGAYQWDDFSDPLLHKLRTDAKNNPYNTTTGGKLLTALSPTLQKLTKGMFSFVPHLKLPSASSTPLNVRKAIEKLHEYDFVPNSQKGINRAIDASVEKWQDAQQGILDAASGWSARANALTDLRNLLSL